MNNPPNQSCSNCRYWLDISVQATAEAPAGLPVPGPCRFKPPVVLSAGTSAFPMTDPTQWCGKWDAPGIVHLPKGLHPLEDK